MRALPGRLFIIVIAIGGFLALSSPASAVNPAEANVFEEESRHVRWDEAWPEPGWTEGIISAAAIGGAVTIQTLYTNPNSARWEGGILFDEGIKEAMVTTSDEGVEAANLISDFPFYGLIAYPLVVDTAVAWFGHDAPDVARNTFLVNLQSLSISAFVSIGTLRLVARERPEWDADNCSDEPGSSRPCGDRENLSFPSGHVMMAFTGASTICVTHNNIPLYGGGFWEYFTCGAAMSAAALNGVMRIIANRHWTSDVIVGAGLGLASGYLLPKLLYYGFGDEDDAEGAADASALTLAPMWAGDSAGMAMKATW